MAAWAGTRCPRSSSIPRYGRGNRVGVVDWLNSGFYHFFPPTTEDGTFEFTRLATGSYLFDEGYTYISIQWNKAVTELFGPTVPDDGKPHNFLLYGSIDRSADAWEILLDAARLLKDPRAYPGGDGPAPVATVLSSGYSQGAALQLELLAEGLDPTRVYDGHLVQMIGLTCWKREDVAPHFGFLGDCSPLPTSGKHAPVIVLASESDMVAFHPTVLGFGKSAYFTRNRANPNWRQYRDGGDRSSARTNFVCPSPEPEHRRRQAHLPRSVRQPDQVDTRQIPREASRRSLLPREPWTRRMPSSRRWMPMAISREGFDYLTSHRPSTSALPVLHSAVTRRSILPGSTRSSFVFLGGTFTRFTDDELLSRYASRRQYVRRVTRAANHLAARGYISNQDRKALIAAAEEEPLPCHQGDDDGNDLGRESRCPKP